jgi:hypothetical protein
MRKALPLLFVALVLAGCSRNYSVDETRAALAAEGVKAPDELNGTGALLYLGGNKTCAEEPRPFVTLGLAIQELRFDAGVNAPQAEYVLRGGVVEVFCNRYDAVEATRFLTFAKERTASKLRSSVPGLVLGSKIIRHGNVVLVEYGRQPRLETALARLH